MPKVKKSIEITGAKISFLSVVDKAANGFQWTVAKDATGKKELKASCKIYKASDLTATSLGLEVGEDEHLIIGPVYEPLEKDAHDNFMTETEIAKAMEYFVDNGLGSDTQHNEVINEDVTIKKCWQLENDMSTTDYASNEVIIKKGAWMAAAIVKAGDTWDSIEDGSLTGWSMGGVGNYASQDVDLASIEKSVSENLFMKIAKALGIGVEGKVEKGAVTDAFNEANKRDAFWNAFYALQNVLNPYIDSWSWERTWESDAGNITAALAEFGNILTEVLANDAILIKSLAPTQEIQKAVVAKAGKKMSKTNLETLNSIASSITDFKSQFETIDDSEEVAKSMNKEDLKDIIKEAVAPILKDIDSLKKQSNVDSEEAEGKTSETETIEKSSDIAEIVKSAIADAVGPIMKDIEGLKKVKGISKQVGDTEEVPEETVVQKSVFSGMLRK